MRDIKEYVYTKLGFPVVEVETDLVVEDLVEEQVFVGNGVSRSFQFVLSNVPVLRGSVQIRAVVNGVEVLVSDSNGSLVGGGQGVIDYDTGVGSVEFWGVIEGVVVAKYKVNSRGKIFEVCLNNGLLWYSARRGIRKIKFIDVMPGVNEYFIDDDVVNVRNVSYGSFRNVVNEMPFHSWLMFYNVDKLGKNWADFYMYLTQAKLVSRLFSRKYDYRVEGNKIVFHPMPVESFTAMVDYYVYLKREYLNRLTAVEYSILRDYVLADFKEVLGRIRGKYSSYPVAGGEVSFNDADALISEAREEKDNLERRLADLFEPLPVLIGSVGSYNF